jgi:hypothetical protein
MKDGGPLVAFRLQFLTFFHKKQLNGKYEGNYLYRHSEGDMITARSTILHDTFQYTLLLTNKIERL